DRACSVCGTNHCTRSGRQGLDIHPRCHPGTYEHAHPKPAPGKRDFSSMSDKTRQWLIRLGWFVLLGGLLWLALRNAPLADIWASLQQLTLPQLLIILALDVLALILVTMRWWIIVRAESRALPLLPLVAYRLAAFALSYFTLGPQVGG